MQSGLVKKVTKESTSLRGTKQSLVNGLLHFVTNDDTS